MISIMIFFKNLANKGFAAESNVETWPQAIDINESQIDHVADAVRKVLFKELEE